MSNEYPPGTQHWQLASLEAEVRNVDRLLVEVLPLAGTSDKADKERKYFENYRTELLAKMTEIALLEGD